MELFNYEERFFWKKIYNSVVHAGRSGQAALEADLAVLELRKCPVIKKSLTDPKLRG